MMKLLGLKTVSCKSAKETVIALLLWCFFCADTPSAAHNSRPRHKPHQTWLMEQQVCRRLSKTQWPGSLVFQSKTPYLFYRRPQARSWDKGNSAWVPRLSLWCNQVDGPSVR